MEKRKPIGYLIDENYDDIMIAVYELSDTEALVPDYAGGYVLMALNGWEYVAVEDLTDWQIGNIVPDRS